MVRNEFLGKNCDFFVPHPSWPHPRENFPDTKMSIFTKSFWSLKMVWNELLSKNYDFFCTPFHPARPQWKFWTKNVNFDHTFLVFTLKMVWNEFLCKIVILLFLHLNVSSFLFDLDIYLIFNFPKYRNVVPTF